MKFQRSFAALIAFAVLGLSSARAQDSISNAFAASRHASKAAVLGVAASGQAVVGVSAVPLIVSGTLVAATGGAVAALGAASAAVASGQTGQPLPLADETITVMSPAQALQAPANAR